MMEKKTDRKNDMFRFFSKPTGLYMIMGALLVTCLVASCYTSSSSPGRSVSTVYPSIPDGKLYLCGRKALVFDAHTKACLNSLHRAIGDSSLPNVNKKFLFVIHTTVDTLGRTVFDRGLFTEAGIKNAVRDAGDFFSKIGMEFEAEDSIYVINSPRFDRMSTGEELGENATLNAKKNRINVFLVEAFDEDLAIAAGIAGGNSMHLVPAGANAGTIAHETGHIFTLQHTFGTGDVIAAGAGEAFDTTDELVDGSNCATAGDFVCDTPADPYVYPAGGAETVNYFDANCVFVYDSVDANGHYYEPLPGNIMSYYESCICSSSLTDGQLRRVANAYYTDANRFKWW